MSRDCPATNRHPDSRTRIAFLGTLGGPDDDGTPGDVGRLRRLVQALEPDLLGIEAEPAVWESGNPDLLPIDIRDGLVPSTRLRDTVVIPLGGPSSDELGARARVRTNERILERLVDAFRRDPGNRFLVVARCQRIHYLRTRLRTMSSEVELVPFEAFAVGHRRPEPRS